MTYKNTGGAHFGISLRILVSRDCKTAFTTEVPNESALVSVLYRKVLLAIRKRFIHPLGIWRRVQGNFIRSTCCRRYIVANIAGFLFLFW